MQRTMPRSADTEDHPGSSVTDPRALDDVETLPRLPPASSSPATFTNIVPVPNAFYPLSSFDPIWERVTFVTGWLLEGTLDQRKIEEALKRVTGKWRMLAGRLDSTEQMQNGKKTTKWGIRIPLGEIPLEYTTFALTAVESSVPLTEYVPLSSETSASRTSLPLHTPSLPFSQFIHPSTPRQYRDWKSKFYPVTCWHITHFPASLSRAGKSYTCVGFARSHGIFDGTGAALVMKALIAELSGTDWDVPQLPPLLPGGERYENPVETCLSDALRAHEARPRNYTDYPGYSVMSLNLALRLLKFHFWQKWKKGAKRRVFIIPKRGVDALMREVRNGLDGVDGEDVRVSSGDIIVAWLLKTIYNSGTPPSTIVHCSNYGSFRGLLASAHSSSQPEASTVANPPKEHTSDQKIFQQYPHNAFVPLPYPIFSVSDIQQLSVPVLSYRLAKHRHSFSLFHPTKAFQLLRNNRVAGPYNGDAQDHFSVSNVSASRILEADWSLAAASASAPGSGPESEVGGSSMRTRSIQTLCGYRYQITPNELLLTNSAYISGRLADESVVLDTTLNAVRLGLLIEEVNRICGLET
ncbi:hypothetical protein D9758_007517 [Tetrapyrgos nigripes]|uniref:Uncharacterized protein n=1 Tax=Tetrapyrgos nigripes TaxID=182062 RepID=A0A8H5LHV1_9AGAR|nr:hypothetical protein D9758_007517 [Tetrapyrgos nigripes]